MRDARRNLTYASGTVVAADPRRSGALAEHAVATAARRRIFVLLITTGTTLLGQLPILLRFGAGEPVASIALVLAAGSLGTLLSTVFVTPSLVLVALRRWPHLSRAGHAAI